MSDSEAGQVAAYIDAIQRASRLKVTGLVNNTHFLRETGAEDVLRGDALVREVGKLTGLPVICTAVEERLLPALRDADLAGELFPMTLRMRPDWLDR